ncbi:MAG: GNAT family N-acetyltransferase [Dehalococcoidales bacterium]|nr:GNAT family N-acetyltransferase [Dehalococcoidales bacterium]
MIRFAVEKDLPGIVALLHQLNTDDPVVTDERYKTVFLQILANPNLKLCVVVENDKVISTCYLNIIPNLTRDASPYAVIENVVTDIAYRNKGYGKRVIEYALKHAWQQGCYKVMLQTGSTKESTHRFYKSCGFEARKTAYNIRNPKFVNK